MRSLDQPDLTMLQALLLLCLHAAGAGKGAQAWMLGGMAFRLCTALRLDRSASADDSSNTWHDQEMMRRTYWTAFLVDRFSGAGAEAPFTMSTEYATLPLPTTERCFLENSMITNPSLFNQYTMDPAASSLGSFAFTIRLSEIWGRLARYANHPQQEVLPHHTSSTYTILKQELDTWYSSLPEYLKFSSKTLAAALHSGEAGSLAFMVCLNDLAYSVREHTGTDVNHSIYCITAPGLSSNVHRLSTCATPCLQIRSSRLNLRHVEML